MKKMGHQEKNSATLVLSKGEPSKRVLIQKSKLYVVSGPLQGKEFMVDRDVFTIGSGPHNDLVLQDSTVSRHHCEIQRAPDGCVVRDLGSTNGTFVQGVRVTEAFLDQGTEFQLGQTKIVFCPLQEMMEYALSDKEAFGTLIGRSIAMRRVFHLAERYAPTDSTVLIEGETGTGKDVLAKEIHLHSNRKEKPFSVIDCGTLAEDLIASELFGHVKGAFTGANADRVGAFEQADGGTVFLDEIAALSPNLQPKLLRVLEQRQIKRVGDNQVRNIDVRIISATNRRLENDINAGQFREDLYFRCSVVHIELSALRNRKEDIPLLTMKFLKEFHGEDVMEQVVNFEKTMAAFSNHNWPGNVRELKNVVELTSYSKCRPIDLYSFLYLSGMTTQQKGLNKEYSAERPFKEAKNELIGQFEREYLRDILEKKDGNISRAAREAGIERAYLQRLIKKRGLKL